MHPNPAFRGRAAAANLDFARLRGFGALTASGPDGPLVAHVPFVLSGTRETLGAHLVRSNPLWRALDAGDAPAVMIVSGPDAYISPDWYDLPDQVPTWNYVAVHLRGRLRRLGDDLLQPHLSALSAEFEARLGPKTPWTLDKMGEEPLARMMRMIAPVELVIEDVQGTWKLGQNKPEAARKGAAAALSGDGTLGDAARIALMMAAAKG